MFKTEILSFFFCCLQYNSWRGFQNNSQAPLPISCLLMRKILEKEGHLFTEQDINVQNSSEQEACTYCGYLLRGFEDLITMKIYLTIQVADCS